MRVELLFLHGVDPSIGRVERESLPQQALMEMVIEGKTNKEEICGDVQYSSSKRTQKTERAWGHSM